MWPGGENIEWKGAVEEGKVAFLKQRLTTQLAEAVGAFELQADEELRFARNRDVCCLEWRAIAAVERISEILSRPRSAMSSLALKCSLSSGSTTS